MQGGRHGPRRLLEGMAEILDALLGKVPVEVSRQIAPFCSFETGETGWSLLLEDEVHSFLPALGVWGCGIYFRSIIPSLKGSS